jgi:hypothetical protein
MAAVLSADAVTTRLSSWLKLAELMRSACRKGLPIRSPVAAFQIWAILSGDAVATVLSDDESSLKTVWSPTVVSGSFEVSEPQSQC